MIITLLIYTILFSVFFLRGFYKSIPFIKTSSIPKNVQILSTFIFIESLPLYFNQSKINLFAFLLNFFLIVLFSCTLIPLLMFNNISYCMADQNNSDDNSNLSQSDVESELLDDSSEFSENFNLDTAVWTVDETDMIRLPVENFNLDIVLGENTDFSGLLGMVDDENFHNLKKSLLFLINNSRVVGVNNPINICSQLMDELDSHTTNCIEILKITSDLKLAPTALNDFFNQFYNEHTIHITRDTTETYFKMTAFYDSHFKKIYNSEFLNKIFKNKIDNDLHINIKSFLYSSKVKSFEIKSLQFLSFMDHLNNNLLNLNISRINNSQNVNLLNINTLIEDFELLKRDPYAHYSYLNLSEESRDLLISKGFIVSDIEENPYKKNRIRKRDLIFPEAVGDNNSIRRRLI